MYCLRLVIEPSSISARQVLACLLARGTKIQNPLQDHYTVLAAPCDTLDVHRSLAGLEHCQVGQACRTAER